MHKDHWFGKRKAAIILCMRPKKAPYLCSPWGFSSLVRTFLSLVLWAAGSQFSCFSQRCTDSQVRFQNTEPVWTGEVFLTAHLHRDLPAHTQTHTFTFHSTLLLMGGNFDPAGCASLLSPRGCCLSVTFLDWISRSPRQIKSFDTLAFPFFRLSPCKLIKPPDPALSIELCKLWLFANCTKLV